MPNPRSRATASRKAKLANAVPENLTPSQTVGAEILSEYSDLAPSVKRILDSEEIDEDTKLVAINLFRDALGASGDPHRDPRKAIATATGS